MSGTFSNFIVLTLTLIFIIAAIVALQFFLSLRENKWLGLILPIAFFCASLLINVIPVFNVTTASFCDSSTGITTTGNFIAGVINIVAACSLSLFLSNIPTLFLLLIHLGCRSTRKSKNRMNNHAELNKMSIQDL